MATFATTAAPTNDTDANFRAWINVWHSLFTTMGGWAQTADTGQINFATVLKPAVANTKQGYALYAMTDALQATNPVILKLAFGSGSFATTPGVWFAVGTHTDGAGNFIYPSDSDRAGLLYDQYAQAAPALVPGGSATTVRQCFGSVGTDRMVLYLFEAQPKIADTASVNGHTGHCEGIVLTIADNTGVESTAPMLFLIERGRTWDGATVGTHIFVAWSAPTARVQNHITIDLDHTLPPLTSVAGMVYALGSSGNGSVAGEWHDSRLVSSVPAVAPVYFRRNTYPVPSGICLVTSLYSRFKFDMGVAGDCSNDGSGTGDTYSGVYITGRTISLSPYGTARTYRTCAGLRMANFLGSGQHALAFVHILYE